MFIVRAMAFAFAFVSPLVAQATVTITDIQRGVFLGGESFGFVSSGKAGPFFAIINQPGAHAAQSSDVGTPTLPWFGNGLAETNATGLQLALSSVDVLFSLDAPYHFTLTGNLSSGGLGTASINLSNPGTFLLVSGQSDQDFSFSGILPAGDHSFSVSALSDTSNATGSGAFDFDLRFTPSVVVPEPAGAAFASLATFCIVGGFVQIRSCLKKRTA